jgi:putative FmdB family regulatory protein
MYEYVCKKCDREFFEICSYKDRDRQKCDRCPSVDVKRKLSNAHFVMDGKMQTLHPNSPDGQARASETRKKHIRKHTHREFKAENKARAKMDGKYTYSS